MRGFGFNQNQVEPTDKQNWLDYLIASNPQGIMQVVNRYGYTGYLAPQDQDEMYEVSLDLIDKYGDQAVVELLKSHPLYGVISDICKEETTIKVPFKNASGDVSNIVTTIKTVNYKKLAEDALIIIGAIYLTGMFWKYISGKGE